jgi:hypothetical protein
MSLPMTSENTRAGTLLWTSKVGPLQSRGWITVPSGRTLTWTARSDGVAPPQRRADVGGIAGWRAARS